MFSKDAGQANRLHGLQGHTLFTQQKDSRLFRATPLSKNDRILARCVCDLYVSCDFANSFRVSWFKVWSLSLRLDMLGTSRKPPMVAAPAPSRCIFWTLSAFRKVDLPWPIWKVSTSRVTSWCATSDVCDEYTQGMKFARCSSLWWW